MVTIKLRAQVVVLGCLVDVVVRGEAQVGQEAAKKAMDALVELIPHEVEAECEPVPAEAPSLTPDQVAPDASVVVPIEPETGAANEPARDCCD